MLESVRRAVVVGSSATLALAFIACTVGTGATGGGGSAQPEQEVQVTSPTSGLKVTATISSVTLGDECGNSGGGFAPASDCAPADPDAGAGSSKAAPGCGGGGYCQQSNMQLAFNAAAGTQAARVEIVAVTLHDSASGNLVDTLISSKPQAWSGSGYSAWDETIKPASELKASYDLSAPKWSTISSASGFSAYGTKYKLHVTLRIDGIEVVLESTDLNREPMVAT